MRWFLRLIVGVKYVNQKELKKNKQFILVSNHNSHLDTMALMSALPCAQLKNTHPIAASEYWGASPIKAFLAKSFANAILIYRDKNSQNYSSIQVMSDAIERGESLIFYPEGSRGEPEKMQEFKKGIGILLKKYPHIPYIPIYMKGMGKVLPKEDNILVPFDSYVIFGKTTFAQSNDVEKIVEEVKFNILELAHKVNLDFEVT